MVQAYSGYYLNTRLTS